MRYSQLNYVIAQKQPCQCKVIPMNSSFALIVRESRDLLGKIPQISLNVIGGLRHNRPCRLAADTMLTQISWKI